MTNQEYIAILKNQIGSLPYNEQLLFAIVICKKLYFNYEKFVAFYQWGDADLLLDAINFCDKYLRNSADINEVKKLLPIINLITPDMDDFGSDIGSYGLNPSASVYETLELIVDQDNKHIFNIASYYTDTIDLKIQEEKDLTELEIDKHPDMIQARNFIIEQTKKAQNNKKSIS